MENGRFAVLSLGTTYDVHLRLIGERVLDFLVEGSNGKVD